MSRFRRLLSFVLPYKWKVAQNVLYNLLQAFFALFSFAMIIPFLQVLFGLQEVVPEPMEFEPSAAYLRHTLNYQMGQMAERHGDIGSLVLVSILVVIFSLLKNGFIYAASYVLAPIRAYVVRDIRNSIYGKVIRLPLSFFTEARKGDVMTRISSDVQELESSLLSSLQMMFRDPITIVVFLVMMFGISFQLTLFVLIMLPLSGFIIGRIGRSLRKSSYRGQKRLGELMSILEETLGGLRIIKAFNGEGQMMESFRHTNHQFARLIRKVFRRKPLASPLSEFLGTIVLMIILLYGGRLVLEGSNDLQGENLIFFLIIFTQILTPAKHLSNAWVSIQKGMASMERIEELLHAASTTHHLLLLLLHCLLVEAKPSYDQIECGFIALEYLHPRSCRIYLVFLPFSRILGGYSRWLDGHQGTQRTFYTAFLCGCIFALTDRYFPRIVFLD